MQLGEGEVTLKNTGNLPAVGVNVARPGHLDTFTVEDNYFWLDAGETRTLKVSDTKGLAVGAWNTGTSQGLPP
jgi:beta-mannosidase